MGEVATKRPSPVSDPVYSAAVMSLEGLAVDDRNDYAKLKRLQRHLEYVYSERYKGLAI